MVDKLYHNFYILVVTFFFYDVLGHNYEDHYKNQIQILLQKDEIHLGVVYIYHILNILEVLDDILL